MSTTLEERGGNIFLALFSFLLIRFFVTERERKKMKAAGEKDEKMAGPLGNFLPPFFFPLFSISLF